MDRKHKRISEQVIVITGASSGIGLVTSRLAAEKGARLVLASRSENALQQLVDEITASGGEAISVVADVAQEEDVRRISAQAIEHFGGFDTWVNNAGVSIYGNLLDVKQEDHRRLFETNFWGVVNGSRVAVEHLRARGGALINIGSTLSDRAIPLQGMYCASKHAVKGFTDALRMELEKEDAPISVTLIKPAAIDTPYKEHAKNYLAEEPENPPPVYAPEIVAETILYCAEHPVRDVFAGSGAKALSALGHYLPGITDKVMEWTMFALQQSGKPRQNEKHSLYRPSNHLQERGDYDGYVMESSLYTKASLHPVATVALSAGAVIAVAALWRSAFSKGSQNRLANLWK